MSTLSARATSAGLLLATVAVVWPAFAHALDVWTTTEEFSYGFLIPPVAALIIWLQRRALHASLGQGARGGLFIVLAALIVYVGAERMGIHALAGIAVSPLLFGASVYLWGWRAGRVLAFPFAFLIFGLGVFRGLLDTVGFALQGITAVGAGTLARLIGLDVVRDGLVLSSDKFAFVVAEPCSGMSSLVSLLALGALWTYAARGSLPRRAAVLGSVIPLAIAANSARVTLVLLVADWFGQDAAIGFFHSFSSLVVFGLALAGLVAFSRLVGCHAFSALPPAGRVGVAA
jgi:exosortase